MVDSDEDGGENAKAMASTQVDVKEYANSYAFAIDMPGVKFGDIRVQVKANNVLFMSSKRRWLVEEGAKYLKMERPERNFMRKFALPENANTDKITAVSRDVVLTVTVEKVAPPRPPFEVKEEALGSCKDGCKVDRISMLPDELLVCILSLLSFKEVCCSSILCRRWRYLHTLTPKLDFDGTESLRKLTLKPGHKGLRLEKEREYIESVDRAVRSHQSSRLSEFRVVFTLSKSHTQHLDEWVAFALSRKVESLDLHFSTIGGGCLPERVRYTFPYKYLNTNSNLRKVSTRYVNVNGEAVEMLLRNCPLLEQVSVTMSKDLVSLEIAKPFPSFTRLEIHLCFQLASVVIRDSSIASFRYRGKAAVKFVFENVPLLRELWVLGMCTNSSEGVVGMFSTLLPHLHIFQMLFLDDAPDFCSTFHVAVAMTSLKELVLQLHSLYRDEDSLRPLIHLIKASPRLQRFVILAPHSKYHVNNPLPLDIPRINREIPRLYPYLKEVEFVGYRGVSSQFRILRHFMKNVVALETILVDPWSFDQRMGLSWDRIRRPKIDTHVLARANALKQCAPFGININIL